MNLEKHLILDNKERIELKVKKKQEVEYLLEGTIQPIKSHFVWELNEETGEIKKAEYKRDTVSFNAFTKKHSEKLVVNPDCIYIPALNAENAKKKYLKNKEQSAYYLKPAAMSLSDMSFK